MDRIEEEDEEGVFSSKIMAMASGDDYQSVMIPRSVMLAIREHYTKWLTEPNIYRNLSDVSVTSRST